MNKSTSFTIITSLTLILGLAGAISLVRNSQDTRSSATFAKVSFATMSPSDFQHINDEFEVKFKVQGTSEKVNAFQTVFCYDNNQVELIESKVNFASGFMKDIAKPVSISGKSCYGIVAHNVDGVSNMNLEVANVTFKALAAGKGEIKAMPDKTVVAGVNTASETDKEFEVMMIDGGGYTILADGATPTGPQPTGVQPTPIDTSVKNIKVKISLLNVLASESNCAKQLPIHVIALNNGIKTAITGVVATQTNEVGQNDMAIYEATIPLRGVSLPANNLSLFIKGPSHLQMKYAVNNQSSVYSNAGGELVVNNNKDTIEEFNFSKVPMLAGDVVGDDASTDNGQNGVINAMDYSYVKALANERTGTSTYLKSDLDGSCQVNGRDVSTLLNSLQEKQSQLY